MLVEGKVSGHTLPSFSGYGAAGREQAQNSTFLLQIMALPTNDALKNT